MAEFNDRRGPCSDCGHAASEHGADGCYAQQKIVRPKRPGSTPGSTKYTLCPCKGHKK